VRLRKACTVVVAPNIEHIEAEGGLDDLLTSILTQAEASNIPIVFALSRKKLGQVNICAKRSCPMPCSADAPCLAKVTLDHLVSSIPRGQGIERGGSSMHCVLSSHSGLYPRLCPWGPACYRTHVPAQCATLQIFSPMNADTTVRASPGSIVGQLSQSDQHAFLEYSRASLNGKACFKCVCQ